jgi:hypothetical protein
MKTATPPEKECALEVSDIGSTVLVPDVDKTLLASTKGLLPCYANEPQTKWWSRRESTATK